LGLGLAVLPFALSACSSGPISALDQNRSWCGRDITDLHSTVLGIRPETGQLAWTRTTPALAGLAKYDRRTGQGYFLVAGGPPDTRSTTWLRLNGATGRSVGVQVNPSIPSERPGPSSIVTAGVEVKLTVDGRGNGIVVTGTPVGTTSPSWVVRMPRAGIGSTPVRAGDLVLVSSSDYLPVCSS
jgi:hypothetical protein